VFVVLHLLELNAWSLKFCMLTGALCFPCWILKLALVDSKVSPWLK
jgi:hypothetical protein